MKNKEIVDLFIGQALNYVIIVKEVENTNVTDFGFDVSNLSDKNEKYKKGIIVSVGESCPKEGIILGDVVLYDGYKTSPLTLNGEEFKTMLYGDLVMSI